MSKKTIIKIISFGIIFLSLFPTIVLGSSPNNNDNEFIETETIPTFSDKEFLSAPVRIEVFSKKGCIFCDKATESLYPAIYDIFNKKQVAIRVLNASNEKVNQYFADNIDRFIIPDDFPKEAVPCFIINGKYAIYGYSEKDIDNYINDIKLLLKDKPLEDLKPYILKDSTKESEKFIMFKSENNNTLKEYKNKLVKDEETKNIIQSAFSYKMYFILCFLVIIFLYFIPYSKQNMTLTILFYFIGNITGILINLYTNSFINKLSCLSFINVLSILLLSYVLLKIFWECFFCATEKETYKTDSKFIKILKKIFSNKILAFVIFFCLVLIYTIIHIDYIDFYNIDFLHNLYDSFIFSFFASIYILLIIFLGFMFKKAKSKYVNVRIKNKILYIDSLIMIITLILSILFIVKYI